MARYPFKVKDLDQDDYEELLEASKKLEALENGGVDNWEGYEYCMSEFHEIDEEQDDY